MRLLIRCDYCGYAHNHWVIPLLSNIKKRKFVVFCWRRFKFTTWYM